MARAFLWAVYYLLFAPIAFLAVSWGLYAYRDDPNLLVIGILLAVIFLTPIAGTGAKWLRNRSRHAATIDGTAR